MPQVSVRYQMWVSSQFAKPTIVYVYIQEKNKIRNRHPKYAYIVITVNMETWMQQFTIQCEKYM